MDLTSLATEVEVLLKTLRGHEAEAQEKVLKLQSQGSSEQEYWQGIRNEARFLVHLIKSFPEMMSLFDDFRGDGFTVGGED